MSFDFAVKNAIILSCHNGYEPFEGTVCVKDGLIAAVLEGSLTAFDSMEIIDGSGKILMPGLTNAHCHGDMTLAKGLGDSMTLLEQNEVFADSSWFYKYITDEDRYYSRQLTYCEALLSGTTFIMENSYWSLGAQAAKAMSETGIRGAVAEDIRYDFAEPDKLLTDGDIADFAKSCAASGIIPVIGSLSEEDFELDKLRQIREIILRHGLLQTCHLAEAPWRMEIIRKKFDTTPVKLLNKNFLLGSEMIGSHVVHLTDEEVGYLAQDGVKVANTPLCEMKICDGIAPIPEMVRQGVCVCLGTDGAMWNNSNDIFREMKGMALLHSLNSGVRSLGKNDILDMATINGAKAFGLQDKYGSIEVGKAADFILVDTDSPHMSPLVLGKHQNVSSAVVFSATGSDVSDVFVNGRQLVKNHRLVAADVDNICKKVQGTAEKIRKHFE